MSEAQPTPTPPTSVKEHPRGWDLPAIAAALDTAAEERSDIAFGPGAGFPLRSGERPTGYLEAYPTGVVRLTTPAARVELYRQEPPTIGSEGVVFERGDASFLSVAATGEATLFLAPAHRPAQDARTPCTVARDPETAPNPAEPLSADPEAPEGAFQPQLPNPDQERRQERVRLAGRLGSDPRFRETRNGVLIGSFPIAVPQDDGSTKWETVVAFKERAAKLRGETGPKKGQHVEVVGYRHRRDQPTRDGKVRTIEEVYAVVVKPR